ncbi:uncharacterized protein [Diadema antillarum]|uniref:uncharacterized protein n=1 Tax=Diadema antillarum TaxID=105358 RepID=UPI003A83B0F1
MLISLNPEIVVYLHHSRRPTMPSARALTLVGFLVMCVSTSRAIDRPSTIGKTFVFSIPSDFLYTRRPSKRLYLSSQTGEQVTAQLVALEGTVRRRIIVPGNGEVSVDLPRSVTSRGTGLKNTIGIQADGDIGVHVQMEAGVNSGAFTPIPTSSLGTDYVIGTYEPHLPRYRSGFVVTAAEEGAFLQITFSKKVKYGYVSYGPDRLFTFQLQAYQSFQVMSEEDLSGTRIRSDMPVAVVSGSECSRVPRRIRYCDYLVEQLPPVHALGKHFVVAPFMQRRSSYVLKFVAAFNDTRIEFSAPDLGRVHLEAGQQHELILTREDELFFTSTQPVLVLQFMKGFWGGDFIGDPSMVVVPPIEQFMSGSVRFSSMFEDHVTVIVLNSDTQVSGLRLDGADLSPKTWRVVSDGIAAVIHGFTASGSHVMSHMDPQAKFLVIGYATGYLSSRAYPVAYNLKRVYVPAENPLHLPPAGYTVQCYNTSMSVTLDTSVFLVYRPNDVTLNDVTCKGTVDVESDGALVVLQTGFDSCGTNVLEDDNTVTFSNSLLFAEDVVTPVHPLRDLPFKCVIQQQVGVIGASSLSDDNFDPSRLVLSDSVLGNLTLSLTQYMDDTFIHDARSNFSSGDAWTDILEGTQGQNFFAVNVTSTMESGVFVDSCWTTPNPNPEDPHSKSIIQDGCGIDDTIRIGASVDDPRFRPIAAESFSPIAEYSEVFMHCRVQVCRGPDSAADCAQACGEGRRRKRNAVAVREVYTLSTGPVKTA